MSHYMTIRDASESLSLTQYSIRKSIRQGCVRFFITKVFPQNLPVTMVNTKDLINIQNLKDNDFIASGIICQKYHIHRSTLHYHRTTGAVRWKKIGKYIYIHRQDYEELYRALRGHEQT